MTHKIKPLEWVEVEPGRVWIAQVLLIYSYRIEQPTDSDRGEYPWLHLSDGGNLLSGATPTTLSKEARLKWAKESCEEHWAELAPKIIESILEQ